MNLLQKANSTTYFSVSIEGLNGQKLVSPSHSDRGVRFLVASHQMGCKYNKKKP